MINKMMWKTIKIDRCFDNRWIKIDKETVLLPNKKQIDFYIVKGEPVVAILGITENNQVFLVDQYRHAVKKNMVDLPGGGVEKGETLKEAAKREFFEETRWKINKLRKLTCFYFDPGRSDKLSTIFVGIATPSHKKQKVDSMEALIVSKRNFYDIWEKVITGKMEGITIRLAIFSLYFSRYKSIYING